MPKIVDPDQRRNDVADAAITVIARGGVDHATYANVAAEAGLVVGSVRHYFTGQAAMVEFAMGRLASRIGDRILRLAQPVLDGEVPGVADRRRVTVDLLCELLPLDDARRLEATAWLALSSAALYRSDLRPIVDEFHSAVRSLVRVVIERARDAGLLDADDAAMEFEVERLAALLDGLALDALLCPGRYSPSGLRAVVAQHLDRLPLPRA